MKISISKSEIKGNLTVPSSKSYTIRGFIAAAMARGESRIINPLASDDTEAAKGMLTGIGVKISEAGDEWKVSGGNFIAPATDLYAAESATTFRFMTAIASLVPGKCRLVPGPGLSKRPITPLLEALYRLGVKSSLNGNGAVIVEGGSLTGGKTELPGNISSQFVSALLLAAPLALDEVAVRVIPPLESKPYVKMTIECLEKFGVRIDASGDLLELKIKPQAYRPAGYRVEGDWSSASYLLALGAVLGETRVLNLNPDSLQGDKVILKYLAEMGADITINKESIVVRKSKLRAIKTDLRNSIDLLPTMGVLGAVAEGTSEFTGIERARIKESNRVLAVRTGLERMGIKVTEEKDKFAVTGGKPIGAEIDSHDDHRIAMAFSILGGVAGDTVIDDAECVSKTFPDYWEVVKGAGMRIKTDGG